jgi:hypothetical protein
MKFGGICLVALTTASLAAGCGPSSRGDGDDISGDDTPGDDDGGQPDASDCVATATTELSCNDGFDEDCDNFLDCEDVDCLNHTEEGCPSNNCGELTHPESTPLALPDEGAGSIETATPYETTINVTGFAAGQTLNSVGGILGVCVTMEHTWIRDLQMEADAPNGTTVILNEFLGQSGGEVFLGIPDESDGPGYGTGWEYCWSPSAVNPPMLEYANINLPQTLPAGDYQASSGFEPWLGTVLNGDWTIRVYDLWGIDNGYIFDWTVKFDPNLVEDCSSWPTE